MEYTLMNKPLVEYREIDIGHDQHLTYTQQYTLYKKWYIGYNSYWDTKHPFQHHSLFIDLDNITQTELKIIIDKIRVTVLEFENPIFNYIGFVLKSSDSHYHIVIPHRFSFKFIIYMYLTLYELTKKESIYNYMVNCINRYFSTFRLSRKEGSTIAGYDTFLINAGNEDTFYPVNYYHWNLMKSFFSLRPSYLAIAIEKSKKLTVTKYGLNPNFMTYYGDTTNEPKGL